MPWHSQDILQIPWAKAVKSLLASPDARLVPSSARLVRGLLRQRWQQAVRENPQMSGSEDRRGMGWGEWHLGELLRCGFE